MLASTQLPANPASAPQEHWSAARGQFRALQDLYRSQSNDPVRRGVLQFRKCAHQRPRSRPRKSRRAVRLKNRSLPLKEPKHGQTRSCHVAPRGLIPFPFTPALRRALTFTDEFGLNPQLIKSAEILFRKRLLDLLSVGLEVPYFQIRQVPNHRDFALQISRLTQQLRNQ